MSETERMTATTDTATDLDAIMAAARETFSGNIDDPIETPAPPTDDAVDTDAVDRTPPETEPIATPEKADAEPAGDTDTPPSTDNKEATAGNADTDDDKAEFKPRFKDHAAAEKGYTEIQAKATKAEQTAADLRKRLERFEAAEAEQAAAETRTQAIADYRTRMLDFAKNRHMQAMAAVDDLDPDTLGADYNTRVAEIMAEKDADIDAWRINNPPAFEPPPAARAAEPVEPPPEDGAKDLDYVAGKLATVEIFPGESLKPEDPVFVSFATRAPDKDNAGSEISFDDQIAWAVEQTRAHYRRIEDGFRAETQRKAGKQSRDNQARNLPIGRTGSPPARASEKVQPRSIASALAAVASENRYDGGR